MVNAESFSFPFPLCSKISWAGKRKITGVEEQGASGTASEQNGGRIGRTSSVPDPSLPSMTPSVFEKQGLPLVPELKQLVRRAAHTPTADTRP